jgi:hypothetical protein
MTDVIDAKIAAAEARTDTKFAQVIARLDRMPSTATLIGSLATAAATIIAIVLAVLAYGSQWFGLGMDASAAAQAGADRALSAYAATHPAPPPK